MESQTSKRQLQRDLRAMFVSYRRQTVLCQLLAVALYRENPKHSFFDMKSGVLTLEQIKETESLAFTDYFEKVQEKLQEIMNEKA